MSSKKKSATVDEHDYELLHHIYGLGMQTVDEYREWCTRHGFSRKLDKNWRLRCQERAFLTRAAAQARLAQMKHEQRRPIDVVAGICSGRLGESDVTQLHFKRLCTMLRPDRGNIEGHPLDRHVFSRLLSHVHARRAKFFDGSTACSQFGDADGNTYIEALVLVAAHCPVWLRPLADWRPHSHSAERQFASLLRHLFVRYDDMPAFFDAVWFAGSTMDAAKHRRWYLHVGSGRNIRECDLPISLTRTMSHHFMRAPAHVTVAEALRWAQVHGLGGDARLARAIFETRVARNFMHDDFWSSVIAWFAQHPMLDRVHVGPIVDYLYHQRFEPETVMIADGIRTASPPRQPNLSMKGRSPETLLRQVAEWHRRLANNNTHQVHQWKPSGIAEFEHCEGSHENRSVKYWTIRELLSNKALFAEGRTLRHCVASYASSCARGDCSIWTMEVETYDGRAKLLTIEVRRGGVICQVRGKLNRLATEKEMTVVRKWAADQRLHVVNG